jgi:hypothetical protein
VVIVLNLPHPGRIMLNNPSGDPHGPDGFADIETAATARRVLLAPGENKILKLAAGIYTVTVTPGIVVSMKEQP